MFCFHGFSGDVDEIVPAGHYQAMTALSLKPVVNTLPAGKKPEAKRLRM